MHALFSLLTLMILLVPLAARSQEVSCIESQPITIETISGSWESLDDPVLVRVKYDTDGAFSGWIEDAGVITWRYQGKWKLDGSKLLTEYTFSSLSRIPVGTTDEDQILSIGCEITTYQSKQGKVKRYRKLRS